MAQYIVKYRNFAGQVKEVKGKGKQAAVFENGSKANNYIRNHKFQYAAMWRELFVPSLVHNVKKPKHVSYTRTVDDDDCLFTVKDFLMSVEDGCLIDYDGFGHPVKDGKASEMVIVPSESHLIPNDATHIVWYNN